jgi:hypothetical protein
MPEEAAGLALSAEPAPARLPLLLHLPLRLPLALPLLPMLFEGFPPFWGSSEQIIFHRILTKPVVSLSLWFFTSWFWFGASFKLPAKLQPHLPLPVQPLALPLRCGCRPHLRHACSACLPALPALLTGL